MATVPMRRFGSRVEMLSRGFFFNYHPHEGTRCPGCGRSHWYVGRVTAECAFCSTAIPMAATDILGVGLMRQAHTKKIAA